MSDPRFVENVPGSKPASFQSELRVVEERMQLLREVCTILVEASDPSLRAKMLSLLAAVQRPPQGEMFDGS